MKFIDPYTADETELRLLQSEPVSFLVLGKSKSGKSEVSSFVFFCKMIFLACSAYRSRMGRQTHFRNHFDRKRNQLRL